MLLASRESRGQDTAKHPVMHRTALTMKNYWAPNINCAKVERRWINQCWVEEWGGRQRVKKPD